MRLSKRSFQTLEKHKHRILIERKRMNYFIDFSK